MSAQSGILADPDLLKSLNEANDRSSGSDELIIVTAGVSDDSRVVKFQNKYNSLSALQSDLTSKPLYVFIKDLSKDPEHYYFVSYVPDSSNVRSKMLYASTKNTLVRQIGTNSIGKQLLLTEPEDFIDILNDDTNNSSALTESERANIEISHQQQKMKLAQNYAGGRRLVSQTNGTPKSLAFDVSSGTSSISDLLNEYNVVSFKINMENEQIQAAAHANIGTPDDLQIITDHPSYTIYKNGTLNYFIYSCPSGSKVKDRMVYASNRSGFITHLQDQEHLAFAKILEIGEPEELELSLLSKSSEEEQAEEDASAGSASASKFNRPRGPTRKRKV